MRQEGRAQRIAGAVEAEHDVTAFAEARQEAAFIAQGDPEDAGGDGRGGEFGVGDLGGDEAQAVGIRQTKEQEAARAGRGRRVEFGPQHGDLLGRGGGFQSLREGGRALVDAGDKGVAFGRHGRERLVVGLDPGGADVGGQVFRPIELTVAQQADRADEMGLGVTEVARLLLQADDGLRDGHVQGVRRDVDVEADRLGLLGGAGGGGETEASQRRRDLLDLRVPFVDHLLGAGLDLFGRLGESADLGSLAFGDRADVRLDDALPHLGAGLAGRVDPRGVVPLHQFGGLQVADHLGVREGGRGRRRHLAGGDENQGGEEGVHGG